MLFDDDVKFLLFFIFIIFFYFRCVGCLRVFEELDLVREIGGQGCYHAHCLCCSQCSIKLIDGDSMGLGPSGAVLCKKHALRSIGVEVSCLHLY